ncbi:TetR/AcrR family transcriptional regulator [Streptomyces sp. S6]
MTDPEANPSARRQELLEAAYAHALRGGLGRLSLRPLAQEIHSSPRVLLYLFGSKDGLIRALLAHARAEELAHLERLAHNTPADLRTTALNLWHWLSADAHRSLLTLWLESYSHSLTDPDGPWSDFARTTVTDWLTLLSTAQPPAPLPDRTLTLAVLRGALLDLLATGDTARVTEAVHRHLSAPAEDTTREVSP